MPHHVIIAAIVPLILIFMPLIARKRRILELTLKSILGFLIVWYLIMVWTFHQVQFNVAEAEARGDIAGMCADTGDNAAALLLGWLPAGIYVFVLLAVRFLVTSGVSRLREHLARKG